VKKIKAYLEGKKTYIVVIGVILGALLDYYGITIPEWAWAALGGIGLAALRAGVKKSN